MAFKVIITQEALRQAKRLSKKYPSFKADLLALIDDLAINPSQGTPLGKDLFKIRLAIRSKAKGRSGGARAITCARLVHNTVYLAHIYDKSDRSTLTDAELKRLAAIFK